MQRSSTMRQQHQDWNYRHGFANAAILQQNDRWTRPKPSNGTEERMENKWDRYDAASKERERLFEEAQELFAESTRIHDKKKEKKRI